MNPAKYLKSASKNSFVTLFAAMVCIGIVSGLVGMFLDLLLRLIQHYAFAYDTAHLEGGESFLQGVTTATAWRRFIILMFCGLVAGLGWYVLYLFGKPLVSIANAIKAQKPKMPILETCVHGSLQIITVALGSPLGREVAPRELGAAFACWLATKIRLDSKNTQILVASAAGAALAAVYNVPLGGALFTLEVLLATLNATAVIFALGTAALATAISWIGLGNHPQYHLPHLPLSFSLVVWSLLCGPIFGMFGYWFNKIMIEARSQALRHWPLIPLCVFNFMMIGLFSMSFPALLGNGKSVIQVGFMDSIGITLAISLLVLRFFIVWTSLRVGANGGLLTPSLANGVLLALILGGVWGHFFPGTPCSAYAVIGAAAFLAASQKMPLTAMVLTAEFTDLQFNFLVPLLFAVTGSIASFHLFRIKFSEKV